MKMAIFILFVTLLSACAMTNNRTSDLCFRIGQEWTYDTRDNEAESRVILVSTYLNKERKRFYVIRVTGVKIDSPRLKNFFGDGVPYFIVSEPALRQSLRTFVAESVWNPHFDIYYERWYNEKGYRPENHMTIKALLDQLEEFLNVKLGA